MDYTLGTVRRANLPAHDDIETDILNQQNGNLSFVLRVNGGNIVDYSVVEYVNVREYFVDKLVIKQLGISLYYRKGGGENPVRDNNS